ncbi:hypothetical protein HC766_04970 [Candidatus Gracilibacteria bacterium]|nr:hypothetical protein [Candidatus Gracilibacteria bacterium]NJS41661.1 hypothetical protein [Candidatus Gracilibacteria bacterium]
MDKTVINSTLKNIRDEINFQKNVLVTSEQRKILEIAVHLAFYRYEHIVNLDLQITYQSKYEIKKKAENYLHNIVWLVQKLVDSNKTAEIDRYYKIFVNLCKDFKSYCSEWYIPIKPG